MRANYLVPVFFTILLAAACLPAAEWLAGRPSFAQTAAQAATQPAPDECLSKPGATAPQGSHWYYRINRTNRRHCWYLGSEGARARARDAATATRTSSPKPIRHRSAAQPGEGAGAVAQITPDEAPSAPVTVAQAAPVPVTRADTTASEIDPGAEFASRWPDLPSSIDLNARRSASMSSSNYVEEHATQGAHDDMPLVWPVLTPAESPAARSAMQSTATWIYILGLLSGALALAAVLVRMIGNRAAAGRLARAASQERPHVPNGPRPQVRKQSQFADALAAALHADALSSSIADACKVDLARPLLTASPERREAADDVEVSLQQLLHAWQRVAA
jgi:hypothetical protein